MAAGDTYVVYRGEEVVAIGTAEEVAEALGVERQRVEWLATPTAHRRASGGPRSMVAERVRKEDVA